MASNRFIKVMRNKFFIESAVKLKYSKNSSVLQYQKRYWSDITKPKVDFNTLQELDLDYESEDDEEDVLDSGPSGPEYGGPTKGGKLKEPTRYGDWERNGRCTDF